MVFEALGFDALSQEERHGVKIQKAKCQKDTKMD